MHSVTNSVDAVGLDVALGGEAEVALDVDLDPQALAVEPVLVALVLAEHRVEALVQVLVRAAPGVVDAHRVVGRDRPVEEAPARAAGVLRAQPGERPALAPLGQDLVLLGDEIGLRADGVGTCGLRVRRDGRGAPVADGRSIRRVRVSYPRCRPTQEDARPRAPVALRGGVPLPDLPGSRPCLCRRLDARAGLRRRSRSSPSPSGPGLLLRMDRIALLGLVLDPFVLSSVFVVNLIALVYRLVAIVDAYRVDRVPQRPRRAAATAGSDRAACGRNPLSIAGLLAVILVMAGSHVVVARYDVARAWTSRQRCIFVGDDTDAVCTEDNATPMPRPTPPTPTRTPGDSLTPSRPTPRRPVPTAVGTARARRCDPAVGRQGAAQHPADRRRPAAEAGLYNTDTLIVVSIDPVTKQVAMFSLPRDTVDVPIPPGPARSVFGSAYSGKINSWFSTIRNRSDLCPGRTTDARLQRPEGHPRRAVRPRHQVLRRGQLRRLQEGRRRARRRDRQRPGPGLDDRFPGIAGQLERVYIPSGIQHMDGAQALRYARSRHTSTDFDRGQRQQRVLLSLREQADPQVLIPHLPELVTALKSAVRTDIPVEPARRAARARVLGRHEEHPLVRLRAAALPDRVPQQLARLHHRAERLEDPHRGQERLQHQPRGRGPAREARRARAPTSGSSTGSATARSRRTSPATSSTRAWRRRRRARAPTGSVPADTKIVVYNGAEDKYADTIAYLETTFQVKATAATDPAIRTDIIVTIGRSTPHLSAPVGP